MVAKTNAEVDEVDDSDARVTLRRTIKEGAAEHVTVIETSAAIAASLSSEWTAVKSK